ncbi:hypothetical protein GPECTOR_122g464 [Gonium pectorale]|uniref:Guanylate cyclase domain-containing protein n=1 Tax=Gonium pectorale TaxID=33097 RepID=A0A150FYN1_GONPE|nr:hypothetical protein GPECTOR_122g464 [Gonium pectorale]|eukprot:KXZ42723.1 hypothetical protein GPECTOR_122g464 [Gonium pectorale]
MATTDVTAKVEAERQIAFVTEAQHRLLEDMFPRHVLAYMTEEGGPWNVPPDAATAGRPGSASYQRPVVRDINKLATSHNKVTLLFADIQGFTPMCKALEPRVVMAFLNDLFTRFDCRLQEFGVYKASVETIGDCYFVAGGLIGEDETGTAVVRSRKSQEDPQHAQKAMLSAASQVRLPTTGGPVRMRIGIHTGPVVSGVVGQRMPRFCLFGDTVNTASRMESTGVPGCIHASETAQALLREEDWASTGGIEVKGKGRMNTFLWAPLSDTEARALMVRQTLARAPDALDPAGADRPAPSAEGEPVASVPQEAEGRVALGETPPPPRALMRPANGQREGPVDVHGTRQPSSSTGGSGSDATAGATSPGLCHSILGCDTSGRGPSRQSMEVCSSWPF